MRKFISVVLLFSVILLFSFSSIFYLADGTTDAMYLKFTTPRQSSLVLGGSRAAQGIQPSHLNRQLDRTDIYNYAFQNPSSPYGDVYLNSIKNKIKYSKHKGLFILEVNPWNMTNSDSLGSETFYLAETDNFLERTTDVSSNPNFEYLIESFDKRRITIIENKMRLGDNKTYLVKDDGWLHLTITADSLSNYSRKKQKIKSYTEKLKTQKGLSDYRRSSLIKTIKFLKGYGEVYLVRLPIGSEMLTVENQLLPDFNKIIEDVAKSCDVIFFDKTPFCNWYSYVDGHHLDVISGQRFSIDLANTIKDYNKTNTLDH